MKEKINIALFLADGFEEMEAVIIADVLRRAELSLDLVGLTKIEVIGSHNLNLICDFTFEEISNKEYEWLILPGGEPGTSNLQTHHGLMQMLKAHFKAGKPLAAICAAPRIFDAQGILNNKRATCYPKQKNRLASAQYCEEMVVWDEPVLTGKGVGAAFEFSLKIVELIQGEQKAFDLAKAMLLK